MVLNAITGAVLRTISLPAAHPAGRGVGGVTLVRDARSRIVAAYAGDANGQLWRFDLRGAPADWKVSYGKPLFKTAQARPIYAAPAWAPHPKGGAVVVLGTGMLLEDADVTDTATRESLYGIWDPTSRADGTEAAGFETISPTELLAQSIVGLQGSAGTNDFFSGTRHRIDWTKHKGWTLMMGLGAPGERVIEQVTNLGSSVSINAVVINRNDGAESCTSEGAASVRKYVINTLDGVAKPAFDINNDGKLDPVFMVHVKLGGFARGDVHVLSPGAGRQTLSDATKSYFDGGAGEPPDSDVNKCLSARFKSVGTNDGFVAGGVDCGNGWSRQQYQLTSLPQ